MIASSYYLSSETLVASTRCKAGAGVQSTQTLSEADNVMSTIHVKRNVTKSTISSVVGISILYENMGEDSYT